MVPLFDDPVSLVVAYLSEHLDVLVCTEVPNERPDAFVVVDAAGGDEATRVSDRPLITLEFWDVDKAAARDRGQHARALARRMKYAGLTPPVYRVNVGGLVNLPDPDRSTHHRYVSTIQPHIRGAELGTGS